MKEFSAKRSKANAASALLSSRRRRKAAAPIVYAGPLVEGKQTKLVEVVSGKVEDRKPSFA